MQIENFEQCLARILKAHNISYSEISKNLNYSSKNTIHRILSGESGAKSRKKVFDDISCCEALAFSKKEIEELAQALEVSRLGVDKYVAVSAMRNLMLKNKKKPEVPMLTKAKTLNELTLDEALSELCKNKNEVLMLNCCWNAVLTSARKLLERSEATIIKHCIIVNDNTADTVIKVNNLFPTIYSPNYIGYSLKTSLLSPEKIDEFNHNIILIRSTETSGKINYYQIILHNDKTGLLVHSDTDLYEYWDRKLTNIQCEILPIKANYPKIESADSYLYFTEYYYKLELNNAIYTYKPDFSFNFINTSITKAAFIDGLANFDHPKDFESEKMIRKLEDIHTKRFNNIFTKKKVTQHVCTTDGIKEFANTGVLRDHFFAMRPYTINERLEVLKHILYHMENNPHFNIHLLKYDNIFTNMEACCFGNNEVHFTSMETNYNLTEDHSEAVITQKDFISLYIEMFTGVLLKDYVKTQTETITFFKEVIIDLENKLQTEGKE